ncbi:hypothetical protein M8C21_029607, partial [Ambrosia artemisiifolia]
VGSSSTQGVTGVGFGYGSCPGEEFRASLCGQHRMQWAKGGRNNGCYVILDHGEIEVPTKIVDRVWWVWPRKIQRTRKKVELRISEIYKEVRDDDEIVGIIRKYDSLFQRQMK